MTSIRENSSCSGPMQHQQINLTDADVFEQEIQLKIDDTNGSLSVFIIDMSGISKLFTRSGSSASASFLRSIAQLLVRVCREGDKVYRIGDCTFGIAFDGIDSVVMQQLAAEKIIRLYNTAVSELEASFKGGISIGIAAYPEHASNAVDLIHSARMAAEAATNSGDPYLVYSPETLSTMSLKWTIQDDLVAAIKSGALNLVYQPKFSVASGRPIGAEALVRWEHKDHGSVPPSVFVPLACDIGMIDELTSFVLMTALNNASDWPDIGQNCSVAVNLDAQLLRKPELYDLISNSLSIWGADGVALIVEITESALVVDSKSNFDCLNRLRSAGIGVAIDDFGTGFSSLSYFKDIPATELKIDQSFISNMHTCDRNRKLVETIIALAHRFDMTVVAEGVERAEEFELLAKLGCDVVQGFYIAEPLAHDDFCELMARCDQDGFGARCQDEPGKT